MWTRRQSTSGDEAREALIRQVTLPVRWLESVREMIDQGVNIFVEVGPGKVLSGLLRQIDRSVRCFNVEDAASLQAVARQNRAGARRSRRTARIPVMFSLKDKVALVTGASQGIGRATSLALAEPGAKVARGGAQHR